MGLANSQQLSKKDPLFEHFLTKVSLCCWVELYHKELDLHAERCQFVPQCRQLCWTVHQQHLAVWLFCHPPS